MADLRPGSLIDQDRRCASCGELVGLYEPAVWATDDGRLVTGSWLSIETRDLRPSVVAHLHQDCWRRLIER
jgi:hypothetical protein